jgi:ADP-ribose pyrophosphatase YjhB (NUDIX family)
MREDYRFCPYCGTEMSIEEDGGHERMKCPACGFVQYKNPAVAAGVIVVDGDTVLLVKRRFEPYKEQWVIPAGFIEYNEDVREAAVREIMEETGLQVVLDRLYSVASCFDDPRGNAILVLYTGHVSGGSLKAGDDAEEVAFIPLDDLPEIAFEAHRTVLGQLREALSP